MGVGGSVMPTPWDTAAGVLMAREAGAVVTDVHGDPHTHRSDSVAAPGPGEMARYAALHYAAPHKGCAGSPYWYDRLCSDALCAAA